MDLAALPSGLTAGNIQKATLTVFVNEVLVGGGLDFSQVTSPWTETGVTFNTQPSEATPFAINVPVLASASFVTIDVTPLVQSWVQGTPNDGLAIAAALASPATWVLLDNKEGTTTSHPASIDVTIASVGPPGPPGPTGTTGLTGPPGPTGPAGSAGTGASATQIPVSFAGHSGTAAVQQPHQRIPADNPERYSYRCRTHGLHTEHDHPLVRRSRITWNLISVTLSTTSATWVPGSVILGCTTAAAAGSVCTATATTSSPAGTIMSLTTSSLTAPGGGGFLTAFSCQ